MLADAKVKVIKRLQEVKSSQNVANDAGSSQSVVSKIWNNDKQNGKVDQG